MEAAHCGGSTALVSRFGIHLRSTFEGKFEKLSKLTRGDRVRVLGREGGFWHVALEGGLQGYVKRGELMLDPEGEAIPDCFVGELWLVPSVDVFAVQEPFYSRWDLDQYTGTYKSDEVEGVVAAAQAHGWLPVTSAQQADRTSLLRSYVKAELTRPIGLPGMLGPARTKGKVTIVFRRNEPDPSFRVVLVTPPAGQFKAKFAQYLFNRADIDRARADGLMARTPATLFERLGESDAKVARAEIQVFGAQSRCELHNLGSERSSPAERLAQLEELRARQFLTDEEYAAKRAQIISDL